DIVRDATARQRKRILDEGQLAARAIEDVLHRCEAQHRQPNGCRSMRGITGLRARQVQISREAPHDESRSTAKIAQLEEDAAVRYPDICVRPSDEPPGTSSQERL